jgi:hypothetical protein
MNYNIYIYIISLWYILCIYNVLYFNAERQFAVHHQLVITNTHKLKYCFPAMRDPQKQFFSPWIQCQIPWNLGSWNTHPQYMLYKIIYTYIYIYVYDGMCILWYIYIYYCIYPIISMVSPSNGGFFIINKHVFYHNLCWLNHHGDFPPHLKNHPLWHKNHTLWLFDIAMEHVIYIYTVER